MVGSVSLNERLLDRAGVHHYPLLDSTNIEARRLAEGGAPGGTVVLADAQSAGRGRQGRLWHSPPGKGIYFSLLLRPPGVSPAAAAPVTLAAAVTVARQIRKYTGMHIAVKWPNDLLIGPKKMGGILTETRTSGRALLYLVLGLGLNVSHRADDFPPGLHDAATSLYLESGEVFDRTALLLDILKGLRGGLELFFREGFAPFQPLWKGLNTTLGNKVEIAGPSGALQGEAVDLDAEGALLVEDSRGGRHRIVCGEII